MKLHPIFADLCGSVPPANRPEGLPELGIRYDLHLPLVAGGWVWATDGAMILRTRLDDVHGSLPQLGIKAPPADDLCRPFAEQKRDAVRLADCVATTPCVRCWDGCKDCWHSGLAVADNAIIFCIWFHRAYLGLLAKHGVPMLEVGETESMPARFVIEAGEFAGVEGVLSPMLRTRG